MTAQSIRMLLRALGTKNDARYNLKIVNTDDYTPAEKPAAKAEKPAEEAAAEPEVEEVGEESEETSSELAEKTRAELADLDDLDI